jgi:1,4-alpha-glucan branching enzyme
VITPPGSPTVADAVSRLLAGEHHNPHSLLGLHPLDGGAVVRLFHPRATAASVVVGGAVTPMEPVDPRGLFEARLPSLPAAYRLRMQDGQQTWEVDDPYRFLPTLGELDLHLIGQGQHHRLWTRLGAHPMTHQEVAGTAFAVWAPNARGVRVVGDMGGWDDRLHPMRTLGRSGVWELFVPGLGPGARYKFDVARADGTHVLKADPLALAAEAPPATASVVTVSSHTWQDVTWMTRRAAARWEERPVAIYEVHLGSWRRGPGGRVLTYAEAAEQLGDYVVALGFTHVELMPIAEHPFSGSWGYQVTGYYAPTARYGSPDGLRAMVEALHARDIGLLIDWVPAHFPRDEWALARFDGTALYEHVDPRRGEQPDWGTLLFNFGRAEVRNFLTSNARYWCDEFHVDGLRVDAVAAMLYLDYSRRQGEWLPNRYGGRENLEAMEFLREVTESLRVDHRGSLTVAEESTAWPGVTRTAAGGGLGFSFKWNMGWMHDTLDYFSNDPVFRRYHHHQLSFGLWYAWSEQFVLPLSHDEVVHGKGSLYTKMPGDRWQKLANLRALYAWMWAHPGKKLLFMGGELAQEREWSEDGELDWQLLEDPGSAGVQRLIGDLNRRYGAEPALWERDGSPDGFRWIDAGNADQNVISFYRMDASGRPGVACVANLAPAVHYGFRVGLPLAGRWRELLNTDAGDYGGSGVGNLGGAEAAAVPWNGQPCSAELTLPPLAVVWLGAPEAG